MRPKYLFLGMVETKAQEFSQGLPNLFVLCVCPHGSGGDSYGAGRIKDISFFWTACFSRTDVIFGLICLTSHLGFCKSAFHCIGVEECRHVIHPEAGFQDSILLKRE